jgi:hypothetical protein
MKVRRRRKSFPEGGVDSFLALGGEVVRKTRFSPTLLLSFLKRGVPWEVETFRIPWGERNCPLSFKFGKFVFGGGHLF